MILYFSGTGNSEYVARKIAEELGDDILNLFDKIRSHDYSISHSDRPWVIVSPTYAWQIPRLLYDWLSRTEFKGNRDIYFVMTCGGGIGNADAHVKKLSVSKGLHYLGCAPVIMPENYIAMFQTPEREEALKIVEEAEETIKNISLTIKNRTPFSELPITWKDKLSSGIVNSIYYPLLVHARKFYATDACISCGKCEKICPLGNIHLEQGKPVWGNQCTHCMACICRCPKEAIEYGKHSKGLTRYTCP